VNWSFGQVWVWCLLAFLLGALIVFLILRLRTPDQTTVDDEPAADDTPTGEIPILTDVAAPAAEPAWTPGPYPGSARPQADGSAPAERFTIKGNPGSMLYHTPDSPYFSRTKAEVWFSSTDDAEAAGFTGWNKRRAKATAKA
jgi:hypothetical protein